MTKEWTVLLCVQMKTPAQLTPAVTWKAYPMGGKGAEHMEKKGKTAFHSHAVDLVTGRTFCGCRADFLCLDDSQAEPMPDCPVCLRKVAKIEGGK